MTVKQRLFIKYYLEYGNATEAAMHVYNVKKRATAAEIGYENLRKPEVRQAIQGYFERVDLAPVYVAEILANASKNVTIAQQLTASITYLKIMGLYPCPHNKKD